MLDVLAVRVVWTINHSDHSLWRAASSQSLESKIIVPVLRLSTSVEKQLNLFI